MQKWTEVLGGPGFRRAAANFGWLSVERVGRVVLGALVGLLVARYLGPDRLGSLSYCAAIVLLLGFLPALGLDPVIKRELLRRPTDTAELLASAFLARLLAGAVGYLGVLAAAYSEWGVTGVEARVFAILGLILFQPVLHIPDLWLQTQLRAKWSVGVQLAALAVSSLLRIALIASEASLPAFAWVIVGEMTLVGAGYFVGGRKAGLSFPLTAARVATMRRLVGEAWPLMFASLAIVVYMKIDEVMLRQLTGPAEVGIYAAAAKLSEIWYFVPTALASSLLPALLRSREQNATNYGGRLQQYYDFSAAAAYALSVPIALLAPWIIRLAYGAEFSAAGPILAVHIWSSVFVFLGVARGQWLVNEGLQKFYLASTAAGAVANIALNFIAIPRWGGLGAAYATVISYALAAWLTSYFHPAVRAAAVMQTRALLIPLRGWSYLRRA
jgi:polysaccharide transporter, PST family